MLIESEIRDKTGAYSTDVFKASTDINNQVIKIFDKYEDILSCDAIFNLIINEAFTHKALKIALNSFDD